GHHIALRAPLQRIVADGCRSLQRGLDVTGLDEWRLSLPLEVLVRAIGPHAGETIGLQFDCNLNVIGLRSGFGALLRLLRLGKNAEQILHVMPNLVGNHVSFGELTRLTAHLAAAKARRDLIEKRSVEINFVIHGAIEWAHCRLRNAAAGTGAASVQDQHGGGIGATLAGKRLFPFELGAAANLAHDSSSSVLGSGGAARAWRRRDLRLLSAAEDFRTANEHRRIDAERPANQPQHHNGTNAEATTPDRDAKATAAAAEAAFTAAILDVAAFLQVFQAHGLASTALRGQTRI